MVIVKDNRFYAVFIIGHSVRFCQVFACVFGRFFVHLQSLFPPFPMGEALIYDSKPHYRR